MRTVYWLSLAICGVAGCHQAGRGGGSSDTGDLRPFQPIYTGPEMTLCESLIHPTPTSCPYPYQPVDAAQAGAICNGSNPAPGMLTSTCSFAPTGSLTMSGTWVPGKVSARYFSVQIRCPGDPNHPNPNVWRCGALSATLQFVDDTALTFDAPSGANVEIDRCSPASFSLPLSGTEGWSGLLTLQVPAFGHGPFATQDATLPSQDANAVSIALSVAPPRAKPYAPGTFTDGTVTFSEVSLDPNHDLAFTLDANISTPAAALHEEFAIFCGSDGPHSGGWFNFQSD